MSLHLLRNELGIEPSDRAGEPARIGEPVSIDVPRERRYVPAGLAILNGVNGVIELLRSVNEDKLPSIPDIISGISAVRMPRQAGIVALSKTVSVSFDLQAAVLRRLPEVPGDPSMAELQFAPLPKAAVEPERKRVASSGIITMTQFKVGDHDAGTPISVQPIAEAFNPDEQQQWKADYYRDQRLKQDPDTGIVVAFFDNFTCHQFASYSPGFNADAGTTSLFLR